MRPAIAIVAALGAVAATGGRVQLARAGCHGGGGGGGHGGGGSGGGGHGHGSWHTTECDDASDVIGFRRCTRFAAWSSDLRVPHIIIEGGGLVRRFPTLLDHQTGSVSHGSESFAYRVIQPSAARRLDTAAMSSLRARVGLPRGVYTGVEADLGGLVRAGGAGTEMMSTGAFGSPALQQERGLIVDGLGMVGVHGATGFGGLGVEMAGGVRAVSYSFHSSYHGCDQSTSIRALAAVAEARARGELWLGPWVTAGVMVGASVLERNAWMGGVYLGVHSRAFGGER